jgi:hypothetical protein
MNTRNKILVVVDGGVIQDILGIPKGFEVVVRDFDIEGLALEDCLVDGRLFVGPGGDLCTQVTYERGFEWEDEVTRPATEEDISE